MTLTDQMIPGLVTSRLENIQEANNIPIKFTDPYQLVITAVDQMPQVNAKGYPSKTRNHMYCEFEMPPVPKLPGVHFWFILHSDGPYCIHVGKSVNLRDVISSYRKINPQDTAKHNGNGTFCRVNHAINDYTKQELEVWIRFKHITELYKDDPIWLNYLTSEREFSVESFNPEINEK